MITSSLAGRTPRARRRFLLGAVTTVAVAALAVGLLTTLASSTSGAQSGAQPVDPHLVLHPATVAFSGTLGALAVSGSLYPAIPGSNATSYWAGIASAAESTPIPVSVDQSA